MVAFNGGLDMLLDGPFAGQGAHGNFLKSMPNVSFVACGNTLETLAAKEEAAAG